MTASPYDAANRPLTFAGQAATHDANGNLTSIGADTFTWNVRNQLVGMTGPGLSASFGYDAFCWRRNKTLNGQTTEYLSDGLNPLQEQAVAGGPWTALTMTGPGLDEILARGDASQLWLAQPALLRCVRR